MRAFSAEVLGQMIDTRREYEDYPLTICPARYQGSYEGARYVAFPLDPGTVGSTDYDADDIECAEFWTDADRARLPFGRGASPDEALADLRSRMEAWRSRTQRLQAAEAKGGESARALELRKRITRNPAVMEGEPTIRGMRVTVGMILTQLAAGTSRAELLDLYTYLEEEDIDAALVFAADLYEASGE